VSFRPGDFSTGKLSSDRKIVLSDGLSARPIARAGKYVQLADGSTSSEKFHSLPDGAGVLAKNDNGWLYASNAENYSSRSKWYDGGVGVLEFNSNGKVIGYQKVASGTRSNCGGGMTPWNSWITCEEAAGGRVVQTDPYGNKAQTVTALGNLGWYESFSYDDDTTIPTFYVTRDSKDGVVTRFTPDDAAYKCYLKPNDYERWCTLNSGSIDYLHLSSNNNSVEWTTDYFKASQNANELYPSGEGVDVRNGVLFFTSKSTKQLLTVNLRTKKYSLSSTKSGAFQNQPDQIANLFIGPDTELLLFCEDGGPDAGLHGRNRFGQYFTLLYRGRRRRTEQDEEATGLGMSPDGKHLYVSLICMLCENGAIHIAHSALAFSFKGMFPSRKWGSSTMSHEMISARCGEEYWISNIMIETGAIHPGKGPVKCADCTRRTPVRLFIAVELVYRFE
jgi:hypothetical protein